MHYKICNSKRNIKTTDIYLKLQIYLDESQRFEYYFVIKYTIEWAMFYVR